MVVTCKVAHCALTNNRFNNSCSIAAHKVPTELQPIKRNCDDLVTPMNESRIIQKETCV